MISDFWSLMSIPVLGVWPVWAVKLFWYLVILAISTGVSYLLAPRPKRPEGAGGSEFDLPTSMVGRPIPMVRGKRWVTGTNALSPIFKYAYEKNGDGTYYFGWDFWLGICRSADGIKMIKAGGIVLWPTLKDDTVEAADGELSAFINAAYVFGGRQREGGQGGTVQFLYGRSSQTLFPLLQQYFGPDIPPGRGLLSVVYWDPTSLSSFGSYYWGTTTYPKHQSFLIKNTVLTVDYDPIWQAAYANIGDDDFNPIHAIYEWLTDPKVGRGMSTALIGNSFAAAAQTIYNEGFGISYVLDTTRDQIEDYIDTVCDIINGVVYYDPNTGKFEITLIRDDYDPDALTTHDEDDFWVESFMRPSLGRVPSRVVVKFVERITNDPGTGTDDDIALLEAQGDAPVIHELDYSAFVVTQAYADHIAARVQQQFSSLGAKLTLNCLRTMANYYPGDVFKISYPQLNIASMIVRVLAVDTGELTDDRVVIEVVEDVFGTVYTQFGTAADPPSNPQESALDSYSGATFTTSITETGPY